MIENGKKVKLNYTLSVEGELVESTKGVPFEYVHGQDNIIPGLVAQLEGMQAEDEKTIVVPPEEGYGTRSENALQEVSRSKLPEDIQPELGMSLQLETGSGDKKIARVAGVRDDSIILDFNHPLAGKTLVFDIKVVEIQ